MEWVVPYNMKLLKLFNCQLNLEICSSVKSIKCVIKYTMTGSDQAMFRVNREDEITQYLTRGYIDPLEAVASVFGFPVHERDLAVVGIQIHLPEQNQIFFRDNTDIKVNDRISKTTLYVFDLFAKTLYYANLPLLYTWSNNR